MSRSVVFTGPYKPSGPSAGLNKSLVMKPVIQVKTKKQLVHHNPFRWKPIQELVSSGSSGSEFDLALDTIDQKNNSLLNQSALKKYVGFELLHHTPFGQNPDDQVQNQKFYYSLNIQDNLVSPVSEFEVSKKYKNILALASLDLNNDDTSYTIIVYYGYQNSQNCKTCQSIDAKNERKSQIGQNWQICDDCGFSNHPNYDSECLFDSNCKDVKTTQSLTRSEVHEQPQQEAAQSLKQLRVEIIQTESRLTEDRPGRYSQDQHSSIIVSKSFPTTYSIGQFLTRFFNIEKNKADINTYYTRQIQELQKMRNAALSQSCLHIKNYHA